MASFRVLYEYLRDGRDWAAIETELVDTALLRVLFVEKQKRDGLRILHCAASGDQVAVRAFFEAHLITDVRTDRKDVGGRRDA